ncbi:hypothetical protein D1BOALGB6SA_2198 [Olavius sp. associated proteobacterium Delta 1]|nr:hypothetical protein D1BOALGB6SA_2198 [Olavius sp. associated proteobacterium Delta 1]
MVVYDNSTFAAKLFLREPLAHRLLNLLYIPDLIAGNIEPESCMKINEKFRIIINYKKLSKIQV